MQDHRPALIPSERTKTDVLQALVDILGKDKVVTIQSFSKQTYLVQFNSTKEARTVLSNGFDLLVST